MDTTNCGYPVAGVPCGHPLPCPVPAHNTETTVWKISNPENYEPIKKFINDCNSYWDKILSNPMPHNFFQAAMPEPYSHSMIFLCCSKCGLVVKHNIIEIPYHGNALGDAHTYK
jgi:hypothetical protein